MMIHSCKQTTTKRKSRIPILLGFRSNQYTYTHSLHGFTIYAIKLISIHQRSVYLNDQLFVVFFVTTFNEFVFDIFPQLTFVVVFVPVVNSNVKEPLEGKGTGKNSGNVNRVSLE